MCREPRSRILAFLIAITSFTLMGCGKPVRDPGEFASYLERFEEYSLEHTGKKLEVIDIKIQFKTVEPDKLGHCLVPLIGTPEISINKKFWDDLPEDTREILMLHELGHCILGRPHDNTENVSGRRWKSLMAQWPQRVYDYKNRKSDYVKELFTL